MEIRTYENSDEGQLLALWGECDLIRPQNHPLADIARKHAVDAEGLLVGVLEGRIVASVMVGYEGHRGWINYLAVAEGQRRLNLGRQMMDRAEAMLRGRGCVKINLQVRSTNRSVIEFYKKLGFVCDDVVSMGKRLVEDEIFGGEQ